MSLRSFILRATFVSLSLVSSGLRAGEEAPVTRESIRAVTGQLAADWERLDVDAYLEWFAKDFVFYFEGQQVEREVFEASVRDAMAALRSSTFEVSDARIRILGEDAAVISFHLRELMIDASGATTDLRAAMTLVWFRGPEGWRVVQAHESLSPPGQPQAE